MKFVLVVVSALVSAAAGQSPPANQQLPFSLGRNSPAVRLQNSPAVRLQNSPAFRLQNSPAVRLQNSPAVRLQNSPAVGSNLLGQPTPSASLPAPVNLGQSLSAPPPGAFNLGQAPRAGPPGPFDLGRQGQGQQPTQPAFAKVSQEQIAGSFEEQFSRNQALAGVVPGRFSYSVNSVHPAPEVTPFSEEGVQGIPDDNIFSGNQLPLPAVEAVPSKSSSPILQAVEAVPRAVAAPTVKAFPAAQQQKDLRQSNQFDGYRRYMEALRMFRSPLFASPYYGYLNRFLPSAGAPYFGRSSSYLPSLYRPSYSPFKLPPQAYGLGLSRTR